MGSLDWNSIGASNSIFYRGLVDVGKPDHPRRELNATNQSVHCDEHHSAKMMFAGICRSGCSTTHKVFNAVRGLS